MTRDRTAASISAVRDAIGRAGRRGNSAMPPTRWQPVHFSRTIGATSRVKLGSADGAGEARSRTRGPRRDREGEERRECEREPRREAATRCAS